MNARAETRVSPQEIAAARARFPRAFGPTPRTRFLRLGLGLAVLAYLVTLAGRLGLTPERLAAGSGKLGDIALAMVPPSDGGSWDRIALAIGETIAMALLGTLIAAAIALPLGFLAARTVVRSRAIHFVIRRVFDVFRGVPILIWALIFVRATGLGPMAGVLAMAASDFAALAKLNAEAIESVDSRPIEGVASVGASAVMTMRFGVLPQVAPVMVSQALYAFESNVRSAAILGVVGAGGIGFELQERIRINRWDEVAFIILLFLLVVAAIDFVSQRLRESLMGGRRLVMDR